jgi:hypothetical protein
MTFSERLESSSRLQRVRHVDKQRRLTAQANAMTRHPSSEPAVEETADQDLDTLVAEVLSQSAELDVEELLGATAELASWHVCAECGTALPVPKRGRLPRFCGPTCRKRAERRRNRVP